ncbi:(2Fe-2S)-binding protein [Mesorhizobium sp. NPDC059054]|uniref:(2Fe-2S)-binding protein n=1 Tax=Mesorhizobium sp. NPDC059054 TaxID=3346711 RepID=UPI003687B366
MQVTINGTKHDVDVEPETPLLWVIRDTLGMTGTKYGCGVAQCGACTVLVDGQATRSCVTPVDSVAGMAITTIEAIENDPVGRKVVEAWVANQVPQCGYCQSGQVMAATALIKQNSAPSEDDIAAAMVNLCRCGTYNAISAAVKQATQA